MGSGKNFRIPCSINSSLCTKESATEIYNIFLRRKNSNWSFIQKWLWTRIQGVIQVQRQERWADRVHHRRDWPWTPRLRRLFLVFGEDSSRSQWCSDNIPPPSMDHWWHNTQDWKPPDLDCQQDKAPWGGNNPSADSSDAADHATTEDYPVVLWSSCRRR